MMAFITAESIQVFRPCFSWHEKDSKELEHHVSEWVDMCNAGFGLMGEQGTEAIHNHFNQLYMQDIWQYDKQSTEAKVALCKNTT